MPASPSPATRSCCPSSMPARIVSVISRSFRSRLSPPEVASEKGLEEVADAEVAEAAAGRAEHVVALAALRVGEHLIGLGDLLEALRRVRSPVHIGVVLPGELAVGTADLFIRGAPRDAQ